MPDKIYNSAGNALDIGGETSSGVFAAETTLPNAIWTLKVFIDADGTVSTSSPSWAATDYISAEDFLGFALETIKDSNNKELHTRIATYDYLNQFIAIYTDETIDEIRFAKNVCFFRVCFGRYYSTGVTMTTADIESYFSIKTDGLSLAKTLEYTKDEPQTWGQRNIIERAKQMSQIEWTTTAAFPWGGTAGTKKKGLPYSFAVLHDKLIGINVSFETFMTAVHNPKSILYTEQLPPMAASASYYYGVVCSTFTAYALGTLGWIRCSSILQSEDYETVPLQAIQIGDLTVTNSHDRMITAIWRDKFGRIVRVQTTSAELAGVQVFEYTWEYFRDNIAATIKRFKHRDATPYQPIKYVPLFDEVQQTITYSDICTNMGDKATIKAGESITLNPLVSDGYTAIHLYKGETQIGTYSVEDVELDDLAAGEYTAKLYPYTDNAETSFIVAECTASLSDNIVSFSGATNCTPKYVELVAATYSAEKVYALTASDISAGHIDLGSTASNYNMIKLFCANDYGEIAYTMTR